MSNQPEPARMGAVRTSGSLVKPVAKFTDGADRARAHNGLLDAGFKMIDHGHGHSVYKHKDKGYMVLNHRTGEGHLHHPIDGHMGYTKNEIHEVFPRRDD